LVETPPAAGQTRTGGPVDIVREGQEQQTTPASGAATSTAPNAASAGAADFGALATAAATATGEDLYAIILYRPIHRTKTAAGTMTREAAKAMITREAATAPTRAGKVAAVRRALRTRIEEEVRSLVGVYNSDAQATAQIRNSARAGLDRIMQLNENFNFRHEAAPPGAAAPPSPTAGLAGGATGPNAARGTLTAAQVAAENGQEGEVRAYSAFGRRGHHTEADHVLEKAFPLSVLRTDTESSSSPPRTFGDARLVAQLNLTPEGLLPRDIAPEKKRQAEARLEGLKALPFNARGAGPLARGYDLNAAMTMLLYRPVAARVTRQTPNSGSWRDIVQSFGDAQKAAIRGYILDLDGVGLDTVRASFKGPLRGVLVSKFERHMGIIRGEYNNEMATMQRLNARDPQRGAASQYAQQLMARINTGATTLRGDLDGLF
ncbi:MAG: hypothetical protein K0R83_1164, partial [Caulobacter sp.]|nr:hypothetical protein [Caulobacter sp.]